MSEQAPVTKLNFQTHKPQLYSGWGGIATVNYCGKCVVCGSTVYQFEDGSAEPRGPLGERHAVDWLHASEYDKAGADIPLCFSCGNIREKYERGLAIARRSWYDSDTCDYGHEMPSMRLDLGGGGGIFLCGKHWAEEMRWRKVRNTMLEESARFDILPFPTEAGK
jgi:hypothetical protein